MHRKVHFLLKSGLENSMPSFLPNFQWPKQATWMSSKSKVKSTWPLLGESAKSQIKEQGCMMV